MRFMIIVKSTATGEAGARPDRDLVAALADYHEQLTHAGVLLDAARLQPSARGWRIRYAGGRRSVLDGPFAETPALVTAYTLIQVRSREEALEWTRRFPAHFGDGAEGEIEVRPLVEIEATVDGDAAGRFRAPTTSR